MFSCRDWSVKISEGKLCFCQQTKGAQGQRDLEWLHCRNASVITQSWVPTEVRFNGAKFGGRPGHLGSQERQQSSIRVVPLWLSWLSWCVWVAGWSYGSLWLATLLRFAHISENFYSWGIFHTPVCTVRRGLYFIAHISSFLFSFSVASVLSQLRACLCKGILILFQTVQ